MVYDQLNDKNTYTRVNANADKKTMSHYLKFIESNKNKFTKNEYEYMSTLHHSLFKQVTFMKNE